MEIWKLVVPLVGIVVRGRATRAIAIPARGASCPSTLCGLRHNAVPRYVEEVVDWLKSENVVFSHRTHFMETENRTLHFVQLDTHQENKLQLLHLIQSPSSLEECLPAGLARSMTDKTFMGLAEGEITPMIHSSSIIHLHQDVWSNPRTGSIVKARLLCRQGRVVSRIYARKTVVRRIDGPTASAFLQTHHLWGATKSKYSFGLFAEQHTPAAASSVHGTIPNEELCNDRVLVAVATFSSRRHVVRGSRIHRSHELIRFCSRRDGIVVGGITKLLAAFIKYCAPDDIVTVVDRDWGVGHTGWHPLGFATVAIMPPVPMAIHAQDGTRHHFVGAGIQPEENNTAGASQESRQHRLGLPTAVRKELASIGNYSDAVKCLDRHGFYIVHDAGVERLLLILPAKDSNTLQKSAVEAWMASKPRYSTTYYSENAGINLLIRNAET